MLYRSLTECITRTVDGSHWQPGEAFSVIRSAGYYIALNSQQIWPENGEFIARIVPAGEPIRQRDPEQSGRGRKRQYESAADKQRAYRERKAQKEEETTARTEHLQCLLIALLSAAKTAERHGFAFGIDWSSRDAERQARQLEAGLKALRPQPAQQQSQEPPRQTRQRRDPRSVLGVSDTASATEIKKAWRDLCVKLHPDRVQGAGIAAAVVEFAAELLKEVNDAYDRLR